MLSRKEYRICITLLLSSATLEMVDASRSFFENETKHNEILMLSELMGRELSEL
jgi:hypothetical protein